jgi:ubiquinone/menaquinone biosynthesis C-methylase UbiE
MGWSASSDNRPVLRRAATSLALRVADAVDGATGRRDPLVPSRRLNFVGNSDFRATGDEFLGYFRELAGLSPGDRVLDIGCGIGRMARVLVGELAAPEGSYDGFDVSRPGIEWCRERYRGTAAPFRFAHVDLHHGRYNPGGHASADSFTFPYPDDSFDLAIATSVFTHLLDGAAQRYLSEAARVLDPGGRLFSTWFLVDPDRPPDPAAALFSFHPTGGAAQVTDSEVPEDAVAYPIEWVRQRLSATGLTLREPVQFGSWSGHPGLSGQDITVADRV